jgi:hypothetical protein
MVEQHQFSTIDQGICWKATTLLSPWRHLPLQTLKILVKPPIPDDRAVGVCRVRAGASGARARARVRQTRRAPVRVGRMVFLACQSLE